MPPEVNRVVNLKVKEISLVPIGANGKTFLLTKEATEEDLKNAEWFNNNNGVVKMEEIDKATKKVVPEENANSKKTVPEEKCGDKVKKEDNQDINKELIEKEKIEKERLQKEIDTLKEQISVANKLAKESMQAAEVERNMRIEKELTVFANDKMKYIGKDIEIGQFLRKASEKLDKEAYEFMTKLLTTANERIGKGEMFKELGTDNNMTDHSTTDPSMIIHKEVMQIIQKDATIKYETALEKLQTERPELFENYK